MAEPTEIIIALVQSQVALIKAVTMIHRDFSKSEISDQILEAFNYMKPYTVKRKADGDVRTSKR